MLSRQKNDILTKTKRLSKETWFFAGMGVPLRLGSGTAIEVRNIAEILPAQSFVYIQECGGGAGGAEVHRLALISTP
jgi:hypothetical protein